MEMFMKILVALLTVLLTLTLPLNAGPHNHFNGHNHGHDHSNGHNHSHGNPHAHAHGQAHVHGAASGSLIIDGNAASLTLSVPALSVLGFEHAPHSDEEKRAFEAAKKKLINSKIITFSEVHGLFRKKTPLAVKLNDNKVELSVHGNHADMIITRIYLFDRKPRKLSVSTTLFESMSDLQEVDLRVVFNDNQSHAQLTPANHSASLK